MPDPFRKVVRGEPLNIPAVAYNGFVDAALDFRRRQRPPMAGASPVQQDSGIILVRNDSGYDADRFTVLGIDSPVFTPAEALDTFQNRVALSCVSLTADHKSRIVVLQEPLAAGALGRAIVSGASVVQINVIAEEDTRAKPSDDGVLESNTEGPACILWKESGTGMLWAVVRIDDSGAIAPPPPPGGVVYNWKYDLTHGTDAIDVTLDPDDWRPYSVIFSLVATDESSHIETFNLTYTYIGSKRKALTVDPFYMHSAETSSLRLRIDNADSGKLKFQAWDFYVDRHYEITALVFGADSGWGTGIPMPPP